MGEDKDKEEEQKAPAKKSVDQEIEEIKKRLDLLEKPAGQR